MVKLNKKEEKVKEANWGEEVVLKRGASVLIGNKKLTFSDVILLKDYEGELAENLNKEAEDYQDIFILKFILEDQKRELDVFELAIRHKVREENGEIILDKIIADYYSYIDFHMDIKDFDKSKNSITVIFSEELLRPRDTPIK